MYLYFNVHLFNKPQILLCSHCILCMISFSVSYIYKYHLEANPYIHRSPPVAHTHWCVERTKSAPTNAHQKRTYRCTPKAHLQMSTKSAPTGAHQKRTCRWPVGAHQKRTYPSFTSAPVKSAPTGAHQKRTYRCAPKAHLQVRTKCAPTCAHLPLIYIFAPAPKAHLPLYKCMNNSDDSAPNTHLYERTYCVGAQRT